MKYNCSVAFDLNFKDLRKPDFTVCESSLVPACKCLDSEPALPALRTPVSHLSHVYCTPVVPQHCGSGSNLTHSKKLVSF